MKNLLLILLFIASNALATIPDVTPKDTFSGNGATTTFPIGFEFFTTATNIEVWLLVVSTGVETLQTVPTEYSVVSTDVVMVTAPASGETLVIKRNSALDQSVNYVSGDDFPAETHETILDKLTAKLQEFREEIARGLFLKNTSTTGPFILPEPVADKFIGWNSGGTDLENKSSTGGGADHALLTNVTSDQHHAQSHTIVSHSDTTTTGTELDTLTDASNADALHAHAHSAITGQTVDDHHAQAHTIASHSDTTATGAELETLTDGSNADALHAHAPGASVDAASEWRLTGPFSTPFDNIDGIIGYESAHTFTDIRATFTDVATTTGDFTFEIVKNGSVAQTVTIGSGDGLTTGENSVKKALGGSVSVVAGDSIRINMTTIPSGTHEDVHIILVE